MGLGGDARISRDPEKPGVLIFSHYNEDVGSANMHNSFNYAKSYPEEYDDQVERTAQTIFTSLAPDEDVKDENIVVVLRPIEYIDHLKSSDIDIFEKPLYGGLHLFLMADTPHALKGLQKSDVEGRDESEIFELAKKNVQAELTNLSENNELPFTTLYFIEGNTFLTSSLVLFDEFWKVVENTYPEGVFFAIPRKDQLFVWDARRPDAESTGWRMIQVTNEDDFNLLSDCLFKRMNGEITEIKRAIL